MSIEDIEIKIKELVELEKDINRQQVDFYYLAKNIKDKLRKYRKQRKDAIEALNRKPGRQPEMPIEMRQKQVEVIATMRLNGCTWREVAATFGYKNHYECVRIFKVYSTN